MVDLNKMDLAQQLRAIVCDAEAGSLSLSAEVELARLAIEMVRLLIAKMDWQEVTRLGLRAQLMCLERAFVAQQAKCLLPERLREV